MRPYQNLIDSIGQACNYKYLTMDEDGSWFVHEEKPSKFGSGWVSGRFHNLSFLPEDTTINWQEAIFESQFEQVKEPVKDGKFFRMKTSEELEETRVKAYKYLM